ncbi:MAG: asparagine synthase (glutamine-hydrolyzing) [Xanthobacteraceae bacterium]
MCGIAGFYDPAGTERGEAVLARMLSTIRYRGPDDIAGFCRDGYGIGMVRLAIVDLVGGLQPALTPDRSVALVFNGEIFNYRDLRRELADQGETFATNSEIEVLLKLYQREGLAMAPRLNGQFAIAVVDLNRRRIALIRDPFGIRPLFWTRTGEGVVFASEVKALAAHPDVRLALDPVAVLQTLRFWTVAGDRSAFAGVHQVPAGHCLTLGPGGEEKLERYWTWPFPQQQDELRLRRDEDYFEAFRGQLDACIRRQSMADVEVGSYLSGGIDSTVLAVRAAQQMTGRLKTYSVTFADEGYDESPAQSEVVEHYKFRHTAIRITDADVAAAFPDVVYHAEAPLFRTAPAPLYRLSERVRQDGIKVVMTGEGADEVLLGYDLFREVKIRRFWERQPESQCRPQLFRRLYHYLPQFRNARYAGMVIDMYKGHLIAPQDAHYAMRIRWANGKAMENCLSKDMQQRYRDYDPVEDLARWLPPGYWDAPDIEKAQQIEVALLLGNYLLSSQGDRMSMSHSVEGRYPYLDLEFVKFAASLPQNIKLRSLRDKYILRNAFRDDIPETVRTRPKVAYQAPEMKAFFADETTASTTADILSADRVDALGLFDPAFVSYLSTKARSRQFDRLGFRDNMCFVVIMSTLLLHDRFVKGRASATKMNSQTVRLHEGAVYQ